MSGIVAYEASTGRKFCLAVLSPCFYARPHSVFESVDGAPEPAPAENSTL